MWIDFPTPNQIPHLRQLWKIAFGDEDAFLDLFFQHAFSCQRCRCVLAEDRIAAVLYWFDCNLENRKIAYIYAVATHPDFRNQGLCRKLMADTHAILSQQGYSGAVLVPQKESLRTMYAGMGFDPCTTVTEKWFPAGEEISARRIDEKEYAILRRKFLPAGGVIQEGENLRFLAGMAQFWAGDDFVAAVTTDGEEIWCPEFLGDVSAVPGLIKMLGYPAGRARMPGKERQFSMFRLVSKTGKKPGYFGFVFD